MTGSSSQSERNFSDNGFIQPKLRNRTKDDKCEKLVYIFSNSKSIKNNKEINSETSTLEISSEQLE